MHGGDAAAAGIRRFTDQSAKNFGRLRSEVKQAWQDLNGFSTASKLIVAAGGVSMLKNVLDANLAFEKTMMQLKWNAQMTKAEIADIRKMSLDISTDTLNRPQQLAEMMFRLGNAGLKIETIKALAPQIAAAAPVFGANPDALADFAFDMVTKQGIREDRLGKILDQYYYHATSGRFETTAMAQEAPRLMNVGKQVGIVGEEGANLMGALTQRMMRNATVSMPSEVSTIAQEGLAHIFAPHYIKGLKKFGIDVEKFFDKQGRFLGEGGVEGIIGLSRAMKQKGLNNPFKMAQAGFREHYTQLFWREMMESVDADDSDKNPNLLKMMERGRAAKNSGQLAKNLEEAKKTNYGKILKSEISVDKSKLSDGSGKGVDFYSRMAEGFSDNKGKYIGAGVSMLIGGRYLMNRWRNRQAGAAGGLGGAAAFGGVQQVLVTNWPSGMLSPGEALKNKRDALKGASASGVPVGSAEPVGGGKMGKALKGAGGLLAAYGGWELGYNVIGPVINDAINATVSAVTGKENNLGAAIYDLLHREKEPVKVEIDVKNGNIVAQLKDSQARNASRY